MTRSERRDPSWMEIENVYESDYFQQVRRDRCLQNEEIIQDTKIQRYGLPCVIYLSNCLPGDIPEGRFTHIRDQEIGGLSIDLPFLTKPMGQFTFFAHGPQGEDRPEDQQGRCHGKPVVEGQGQAGKCHHHAQKEWMANISVGAAVDQFVARSSRNISHPRVTSAQKSRSRAGKRMAMEMPFQ